MSLSLALALLLAATAAPPHRILWLWYTSGIKTTLPSDVGVAFVVASLSVSKADEVTPFLRGNTATIPAGAYQMGVIRIEHYDAAFTPQQRAQLAQMIAEAVEITRVPAIQIDFDAPKSAWPFYRALLRDVRQRIGPRVFLSITALVSWCEANSWLAGVEADEVVPMLFRMGPASAGIRERLRSKGEFAFAGCRQSMGVSLLEPIELPKQKASRKRIYIFPESSNWTPQTIHQAVRSYQP